MRSQKELCIARDHKRLGEMAKPVQSSRTDVFNCRGRAIDWEQGGSHGAHCVSHGRALICSFPLGRPCTHCRASSSNIHRPHFMDVKSRGEKGCKAD